MNATLKFLTLAGLLAFFTANAQAAFSSGSDGSDGALVFENALGDVIFDPDAYDPPLDPDRDGIYNFTTITVGAGTYVALRGDVLGEKPLIWLATGDVQMNGSLMLDAMSGPGVGGFKGGLSDGPNSDGQGPRGGDGSSTDSSGAFPSVGPVNPYLVPLIGGSGQGAGTSYDGYGGGGAMLLASSGEISIDGQVYAYGPSDWESGINGSGNLRLVANTISGDGSIGGCHVLRMEAFVHGLSSSTDADYLIKTRPGRLFPQNPIKILLVDESAVDHAKPGANKGEPDVVIDNGNEVTILVECTGIPEGLSVRVVGWNDSVGKVEALTGPLVATVGNITQATCTMVIPTGNTTFMAQVLPDEAPAP